MHYSLFTERLGFLGKVLLSAGAMALFFAGPLHAQDDNGGPPPPQKGAPGPDQGQPMQADPNAPPPPDLSAGAGDQGSQDSASFQTFYDSLGSQGTWIQSSDYGYVWQPQETDPNWAPYTEGHWVYTEDGWTWVSDESFGWATYHYGRWVNLDGTGWVWVPGYTWGPAWVSWRYGDGYCGWAPLPPDSFVGIDYSGDGDDLDGDFHIGGDCDGFYGIGAAWYIFLPVNCLGYRHYHDYYHNRGDNFAIINHTTNVTNINVMRNRAAVAGVNGARGFRRVTTGGPMLAQVNSVSSTPVQRVNLVRTNSVGGAGLSGNALTVYAPHVRTGSTAQPAQVSGSLAQTSINRGTDITRPLAVNSRITPGPATEAQVQQARIAQDHAPANAKVVSDTSSVHPILQAPLTSMHPIVHEPSTTRVFNTSPGPVFNTERGGPVVSPTVRSNPQAGGETPSRTFSPGSNFQPHSTVTTPGGAPAPSYTRPAAPSSGSGSAETHSSQSSGGAPSSGGAANNGGGFGGNNGGGSSGGGGGYHGGGSGGGGGGSGGGSHGH
jgi:hypothetical protein